MTADERTAGRRPLAVLGCLVPLVVIALLFAGSAGAKSAGKYRRPYSTAKKTAAAETTGATATATASCPKSPFPRLGAWRATGGGFEIDATYPAHGGVYESRKAGQRSWRVSAQSLSGKIVVFSYAVCRAGATKTTTASATLATPATSQVDPPSDASCPSGKAVAGGFSTPPPFTGGEPAATVVGSTPGGATSWRAQVVSNQASSLTTYAYCARTKRAPTILSASSPPANNPQVTASRCRRRGSLLSGGFSEQGLTPSRPLVPLLSLGFANFWSVCASTAAFTLNPPSLTVTALCG